MKEATKGKKIEKRIRSGGWNSFGKYRDTFQDGEMSQHLKKKVFDQCTQPTMIYRNQTWKLTKESIRQIR